MTNLIQFIKDGIFHVAPILVAGAIAMIIIIERLQALSSRYPLRKSQAFFDRISTLVLAGKIGEAIAVCDLYDGKLVARIVKQALLRSNQPEPLIEQGLQLAVGEASQLVLKRTGFLATIANVATLLGLLGTIVGLIHSFEAVGHADPQQKSALLAAGISQSMNATMLGLAVAIPCMIAYSYLMNKTNRLISEIERAAIRAMDMINQSYFAAESLADRESEKDEAKEDRSEKSRGLNHAHAHSVSNRRAS